MQISTEMNVRNECTTFKRHIMHMRIKSQSSQFNRIDYNTFEFDDWSSSTTQLPSAISRPRKYRTTGGGVAFNWSPSGSSNSFGILQQLLLPNANYSHVQQI